MPPDDRLPNPDVFLRTALSVPSAAATLDAARRGSGNADIGDVSAGDLATYELQRELKAAQARIRALEGAIKTTAKVLAPYAGNGR
jgi:hypothetical protein